MTIKLKKNWTKFFDMHSGGGAKTPHEIIIINAPMAEACEIFERVFGRDPHNTTCDCCGSDYSIGEHATLNEAKKYSHERELATARIIQRKEIKALDNSENNGKVTI
jgi:hypothetical protein